MRETELLHSLESPLAIFILAAPTSDLPRFHPGHTSSSIFMTADPKRSKLKVLPRSPLWVKPSFHRTKSPRAKIPTEPRPLMHIHELEPSYGEGNGNPLQCSCLENPKDGGAWWAAVYGVAQSRTRLKRLSSSSSSRTFLTSCFLPGLMHAQDCSLALNGFHLAFPPGPAQPRSHLNRPKDPRPRSPAALPSMQSE